MKCPKCGEEIKPGYVICVKCKYKLKGKEKDQSKEEEKKLKLSGNYSFQESSISKNHKEQKNVMKETWFIILMIFLCPPVAAFSLWKFKLSKMAVRIIVTIWSVLWIAVFASAVIATACNPNYTPKQNHVTTQTVEQTAADKINDAAKKYELKKYLESNYLNKELKTLYSDLKDAGFSMTFKNAWVDGELSLDESTVVASFSGSQNGDPYLVEKIYKASEHDKRVDLQISTKQGIEEDKEWGNETTLEGESNCLYVIEQYGKQLNPYGFTAQSIRTKTKDNDGLWHVVVKCKYTNMFGATVKDQYFNAIISGKPCENPIVLSLTE